MGYSFLAGEDATLRLAPKTVERFKERIRELTSRSCSISIQERIRKVNAYILGWVAYYRLAAMQTHCMRFDEWIRRRVRMCIWKQRKRVRTRYRELRALGIAEEVVHMTANSQRAVGVSRELCKLRIKNFRVIVLAPT
nr:group II intron maturase-specific domain-containing protein [Alicyclobacillus mali (ex Roth et al. 2021)]